MSFFSAVGLLRRLLRQRMSLFVVLALFVGLYLPLLPVGWHPVDDIAQVIHVRAFPHLVSSPLTDFAGLFRPVKNGLFLVLDALARLGGIGLARALLLVIGVGSLLMMNQALGYLTGKRDVALLATAIWGFAPTLVSSVAWFSAVNILLISGLGAWTLYAHAHIAAGNTRVPALWLLGATVGLATGLLAYEGAISLLVLIPTIDGLLHPARWRRARTWVAYGLYGATTFGYLLWRHSQQAIATDLMGFFENTTRGQAAFASGWFYLQHLTAWVWPFRGAALLGSYRPGLVAMPLLWAGWLVVGLMVSVVIAARSKDKWVSVGVAWFLLGFAPMSNLAGFRNGPWGDYYLTWASGGLALMSAHLILRTPSGTGRRERILAWCAALFLATRLVGVAETARRVRLWMNPLVLLRENIAVKPYAFKPPLMLAQILLDTGADEEAQLWAESGARLAPARADAWPILAVLAERRGDIDEAYQQAEIYRQQYPADPWSPGFLGYLHDRHFGDRERAITLYRQALQIEPWCVDSLFAARHLAYHLVANEDGAPEALALWLRVVGMAPTDWASHRNLARLYHDMGEAERSAHHLRIFLRLRPGSVEP